MREERQPVVVPVAPEGQPAAYAGVPMHTDPTIDLGGRYAMPVQHRGTLSQPESPPPFRQTVLVHPTVYLAPPPRIGDQVGDQTEIRHAVTPMEGQPDAAWWARRNYTPVPAIEPGETEI